MHDVIRVTSRVVTSPALTDRRVPVLLSRGRVGTVYALTEQLKQSESYPGAYMVIVHARRDSGESETVRYGPGLEADRPLADLGVELQTMLYGPERLQGTHVRRYEPPRQTGPQAFTISRVDHVTALVNGHVTSLTNAPVHYRGPVLVHVQFPEPAVVAFGRLAGQETGRVIIRDVRLLPEPIPVEHAGTGLWDPPQHLVNAVLSELDGAL